MPISKPKAFAIHLGISSCIFIALSGILLYHWFPGELFFIDGGWQGMRIIAAVDLILGPMLTLIFYKPGNPSLKFDMSMIVLVQLLALSYGVWSTQQQSTVALAFVEGRFVTVAHAALQAGDAEMHADGKPTQTLEAFAEHHPVQVFVEPPEPEKYGRYLADVLNGKPELHERSHRFRALREHLPAIAQYRQSLASLQEQSPPLHDAFSTYLAEQGYNPDAIDVYKLKARYGRGLAIVSPEFGVIEDIFTIDEAIQ